VDRVNNGSHKDMDFYSFLNSAAALRPYFEICARAGLEHTEGDSLPDLFEKLRLPGKLAENNMLSATGGINTHKGAIFSMGILCAAVGAVAHEHWTDPEKIGSVCAKMTKGLVLRDFQGLTKEDRLTAGQRLYLEYGVTGVRGQMEEGLPAVLRYGLPALEKHLADGKDPDEAGAAALLSVMANMTDTNLIARSDLTTQRKASSKAGELVRDGRCPERDEIDALDREFIDKDLSPGGSADMLALCWMLHFIKEEGAYDA
jgi:holo-ACP synthase/triphosphoribosyl-dephospho-CoA synthase